jgi:hypothetical protein
MAVVAMIGLREAAGALLDERTGHEWSVLERRRALMTMEGVSMRPLTIEEADRREALRAQVTEGARHRILAGEWRCKGFEVGSSAITEPPIEWWERAYLDVWGAIAAWNGVELSGLVIAETLPSPAAVAPVQPNAENPEIISKLPLYMQVAQAMIRDIENGVHTREELGGNQDRVCGWYNGVSRGTMQRALAHVPNTVVPGASK